MANLNEVLGSYLESIGIMPTKKRVGLNYEGELNGRTLRVHCSMRRRTRYAGEIRYRTYAGHQLEFNLTTPLQTRLNFFKPTGFLKQLVARTNKWVGAEQLTDLDGAYQHLEVWAFEPTWAQTFLARPQVQQLVQALIPQEDSPHSVGLRLWPGQWTFTQRLPAADITTEKVERWVTALDRLAELAEQYPPSQTAELTRWEKMTADNPTLLAIIIIVVLVAIFTVPTICCSLGFILTSVMS